MLPDEQERVIDDALLTLAARHPGNDWRPHAFKNLASPDLARGRWTVIGAISRQGAIDRQTYTVCVDFATGDRVLKKGWPKPDGS